MITLEEYLDHCDRALDGYAEVVTELGDDLVNARLDGIPGSNSAFALVTHISGMTARSRTRPRVRCCCTSSRSSPSTSASSR